MTKLKQPKKYADRQRTQVTPEWRAWRDEMDHLLISNLGPGQYDAYFPEDCGKEIPKSGCWIRVLEEPHTELMARFRVPIMSMWRARPYELSCGEIGGIHPKLANILTPGGELCLWPHEYDIVPDITDWVGMEPDVQMHTLGGEALFSPEMEEQLFYIQSRGISRREAALLLLNDLTSQGFCYFTLDQYYVDMFAGVGTPLWRHIALSKERRA